MSDAFIPVRGYIKNLKPSATLLINERSKELIAQGKKVYRLGFGQSPFPVPESVIQALRAHAPEKDYLPVKGLMQLREAVANFNNRKLGLNCSVDDIMIGPGSKELLLGLQMACDADLLLPSPSWVSYEPQAHIVNTKVIWIQTNENEKWLLTAEKLEAACQVDPHRKKILLLNYPSNPVGTSYDKSSLETLAEVARKHKILIVADEIYGELTFEGQHHSLAKFYPEGTIVSSGLSKWCGAGGWRLGTFTIPKQCQHLMSAMATIASESFSAVSAPVQYAAITAFNGNEAIDEYLSTSKSILKVVGNFVYRELTDAHVSMPAPEGGFYLFPNFEHYRSQFQENGIHTSTELCDRMLNESGVALLPGSALEGPSTSIPVGCPMLILMDKTHLI